MKAKLYNLRTDNWWGPCVERCCQQHHDRAVLVSCCRYSGLVYSLRHRKTNTKVTPLGISLPGFSKETKETTCRYLWQEGFQLTDAKMLSIQPCNVRAPWLCGIGGSTVLAAAASGRMFSGIKLFPWGLSQKVHQHQEFKAILMTLVYIKTVLLQEASSPWAKHA